MLICVWGVQLKSSVLLYQREWWLEWMFLWSVWPSSGVFGIYRDHIWNNEGTMWARRCYLMKCFSSLYQKIYRDMWRKIRNGVKVQQYGKHWQKLCPLFYMKFWLFVFPDGLWMNFKMITDNLTVSARQLCELYRGKCQGLAYITQTLEILRYAIYLMLII